MSKTININGNLMSTDKPLIMGILNLTKDSFYDGGRYDKVDKAVGQAEKMLVEGADIIDLGAFSSRPGAQLVSAQEQLTALVPVVERLIATKDDIKLSIDTFSAEVVKELAGMCSFIVNDISGFDFDEKLIETVAECKLPYILMHIKGTPEAMQDQATYEDVTFEVLNQLSSKLHTLRKAGIKDVIVDPGFGFGKQLEHNYALLAKLGVFKILDCPIMVGVSRKSMIYKPLEIGPAEALNGTTALHMTALMNGAQILRVHDVKEAVETTKLWSHLRPHVKDL